MSETLQQKTHRLIGGHYAADAGDEPWQHEVARQMNESLLAVRQGCVTPEQGDAIFSLCQRVAEFEKIRFITGAEGGKPCVPPNLLAVCRCALADLEGILPEFEPGGDRQHPAWRTIKELRAAIVQAEGSKP